MRRKRCIDDLPDAILESILSRLSHARDVSCCASVSKRWNESISCIKSLHFSRDAFDRSDPEGSDATLCKIIGSMECLEELLVYCPFSTASLAHWLSIQCKHLRFLELRMSMISEKTSSKDTPSKLDCIGLASNLESLVLWEVLMIRAPKWDVFHRLDCLQITGSKLKDKALAYAISMCPNLRNLALISCHGLDVVSIDLPQLEECRLDFVGDGDCLLTLRSPKLHSLEVQGCARVQVKESHCLKKLTISNVSNTIYEVIVGKLPFLEFLSMRGVQWTWDAIASVLQTANNIKHLIMKIEYCGENNQLGPFPEINLVNFFNTHQKLQSFAIHGAMFAALCRMNSLNNLDQNFDIGSLEDLMITVRSPTNADKKLKTIEILAAHSSRLKKMVIQISKMKNHQLAPYDSFDDREAEKFFEELCALKERLLYLGKLFHKIIQLEFE